MGVGAEEAGSVPGGRPGSPALSPISFHLQNFLRAWCWAVTISKPVLGVWRGIHKELLTTLTEN